MIANGDGFSRMVALERAADEAAGFALSAWRGAQGRFIMPGQRDICSECGEEFTASDRVHDYRPLCPCERSVCAAAREKHIREEWPAIAAESWEAAGIPARFQGCSFGNFQPRQGTSRALQACTSYADAFASTTAEGLWFIGSYGAGKTHLAVATARTAIERTLAEARFTSAADLVAAVRPGEGEREFHWEEVYSAIRVELLILDDVGQEQSGSFSRDVIYQVINGRYEANRPLILTTNAGDEQLERRYGGATVSRLAEMTQPIIFGPEVKDYRGEIARRAQQARNSAA